MSPQLCVCPAHAAHPEYTPAEAEAVSLAALDLLLKVSAVPEMRTTLRYAVPLLS